VVKQNIVVLDLEGVLVPEIWISVAEKTSIPDLRRTTRDEPDYDKLMLGRIRIMDQHGLKLSDIQETIATLRPLDGALDFLRELRTMTQVIILSDTFEEFAKPLMRQLEWPAIFCNRLVVEQGRITGYKMRQEQPKRSSVKALQSLNYFVIAAGDSFNDTAMLIQADAGFFFHAPGHIQKQFPQFPPFENYGDLMRAIKHSMEERCLTYSGHSANRTAGPLFFQNCTPLLWTRATIPNRLVMVSKVGCLKNRRMNSAASLSLTSR
jgi:phosphoserine/homoserine phosphotransferase